MRMAKFRKFFWCDRCEDEVVAIIEGEISFPPSYAIDPGPGPDVVRVDIAYCEYDHPISRTVADRLLGDIAAGDVV